MQEVAATLRIALGLLLKIHQKKTETISQNRQKTRAAFGLQSNCGAACAS
jgi:hypothetical protein